MHACIRARTHTHTRTHARTHVHTRARAHTHRDRQTDTHTHTHRYGLYSIEGEHYVVANNIFHTIDTIETLFDLKVAL